MGIFIFNIDLILGNLIIQDLYRQHVQIPVVMFDCLITCLHKEIQ